MAFTDTMKRLALRNWPSLQDDVVSVITQAVVTSPAPDYSLRAEFGLKGSTLSSPFKSQRAPVDSVHHL